MFNFKILNSRQNKLFLKYCIIGIFSIFFELFLRKLLLSLNLNIYIIHLLPLLAGIFFAFICNVKFNFNIPRYYFKYSLIYFSIISLTSFSLQFFLSKIIAFQNLNYEISRLVMSSLVFLIAYNFHIKFSFKKNKTVSVAVYLDHKEDIDNIFSKVGFHPDYIHIDMVDKSMNLNVDDPDFTKLDEVRKQWPNHRIESHIMSKRPHKYLDKFLPFSDVIYFHYEIDEDLNKIVKYIQNKGVKPGLVLHASRKYNNLKKIIDDFSELLVLCIDKPGESGQKLLDSSYSIIDEINNMKNRQKYTLCVDGGLSQENISKIDCDKIVSASSVFQSINPKQQIISLQKLLNN